MSTTFARRVTWTLAIVACSVVGVSVFYRDGSATARAVVAGRLNGCVQRLASSTATANPWVPAQKMMAPEHSEQVVLCGYRGTGLRRSVVASNTVAAIVVRDLNELRATPRKDRRQFESCGFYEDPVIVRLRYAGGHRVVVYVATNGCEFATNGDLSRQDPHAVARRLVAVLLRLTS